MNPAARRVGLAAGLIAAALLVLTPALPSVAGAAKDGSRAVQRTKAHFGVLREARRSFDRLPPDRRAYWRQFRSKYGLRIGGARLTLGAHQGKVWLLPGAGWLCMDVLDKQLDLAIGGCQRTWKARRGLISLTQKFTNGKLIFTGAVPDRTRHLRVANSHHRPVPVPVVNNTYRAAYSPADAHRWKPRRIVFLVGHHRHSFKLAGIRHAGR